MKCIKVFGSEEDDEKRTKVYDTSYIVSSDAHFGVDLNEVNKL